MPPDPNEPPPEPDEPSEPGDGDENATPRPPQTEPEVKVYGKLLSSGQQVPLRPTSAKEFMALGYQRVHEAQHIIRDTVAFEARFEALLDSALPKPKKAKKEKKGGGGKKKKK